MVFSTNTSEEWNVPLRVSPFKILIRLFTISKRIYFNKIIKMNLSKSFLVFLFISTHWFISPVFLEWGKRLLLMFYYKRKLNQTVSYPYFMYYVFVWLFSVMSHFIYHLEREMKKRKWRNLHCHHYYSRFSWWKLKRERKKKQNKMKCRKKFWSNVVVVFFFLSDNVKFIKKKKKK